MNTETETTKQVNYFRYDEIDFIETDNEGNILVYLINDDHKEYPCSYTITFLGEGIRLG